MPITCDEVVFVPIGRLPQALTDVEALIQQVNVLCRVECSCFCV